MKIAVIVFCIFVFSCSNDTLDITALKQDSLKTLSDEKEAMIVWIESSGDFNTRQIVDAKTSKLEDQSGKSLFFHNYTKDAAVYPYLEGFGSLDTESIPTQLYEQVKSFISAINKKNISTDFFTSDKRYLKKVIDYSIIDLPNIESYFIGKAILLDEQSNTYEVPLRFTYTSGYSNAKLYCTLKNAYYFIEQFDLGSVQNE